MFVYLIVNSEESKQGNHVLTFSIFFQTVEDAAFLLQATAALICKTRHSCKLKCSVM